MTLDFGAREVVANPVSRSGKLVFGALGDFYHAQGTSVTLVMGDGNDTVLSGDLGAEIHAALGDDLIDAGAGNDTIWAEGGRDTIEAGLVDDRIVVHMGDKGIVLTDAGGTDTLVLESAAPGSRRIVLNGLLDLGLAAAGILWLTHSKDCSYWELSEVIEKGKMGPWSRRCSSPSRA